jgi:hypothetical protein
MEPLPLPTITLPFTTEESPVAAALERHAQNWIQEVGLIHDARTLRRFQAGKFWYLVAHCFPHGATEVLPVVVEWDSWAFMLDDESDIGHLRANPMALRRLLDDLLRVLDGELPRTIPLFTSLHQICVHLQPWTTPAWWGRFRRSVADTFDSLVWEAENRARGIPPDLVSYLRWRRASSGLATHLDLADFTDAIALPDDLRHHPVVRQLTECANNIISWTNDVYSLAKEVAHREVHNLVVVLAHAQRISLAAAMPVAEQMIQAELAHFLMLQDHLPLVPDPVARALQRYLAVLRSWMQGNLDWSRATGRYDVRAVQDAVEAPAADRQRRMGEQAVRPSMRLGYGVRRFWVAPAAAVVVAALSGVVAWGWWRRYQQIASLPQ